MLFVDTHILIRFHDSSDDLHSQAVSKVAQLHRNDEALVVAPQCIYELWSVLTRPRQKRGVGLTPSDANAIVQRLPQFFRLVPDPAGLFTEWLRLVNLHGVSGKESHDARLVAFMNLSAIDKVVTFNGSDFARYGTISVIDPGDASLPQ